MREIGLDISGKRTKAISGALRLVAAFLHVIAACDDPSADRCSVLPGGGARMRWGFPAPSAFRGSRDTVLVQTREVRDAIRKKIQEWCDEMCPKDKC